MSPASFQIAPPRFCRGRESNPHELEAQGILSPRRLPVPPPRHLEIRAGNGIRTRDLHLGKVALYQLSYSRLQAHYTEGALPPSRLVRRAGFEPARPKALAPKASASANSATFAPANFNPLHQARPSSGKRIRPGPKAGAEREKARGRRPSAHDVLVNRHHARVLV